MPIYINGIKATAEDFAELERRAKTKTIKVYATSDRNGFYFRTV